MSELGWAVAIALAAALLLQHLRARRREAILWDQIHRFHRVLGLQVVDGSRADTIEATIEVKGVSVIRDTRAVTPEDQAPSHG